MRKILKKLSTVVQIVLMAPIKLPVKVLGIVKYIAVGLGIIESVLEKDKAEEEDDAA